VIRLPCALLRYGSRTPRWHSRCAVDIFTPCGASRADEPAGVFAREVDAQRHAAGEIGIVDIDQPLLLVQRIEFIGGEDGVARCETAPGSAAIPRAAAAGNVFGLISA